MSDDRKDLPPEGSPNFNRHVREAVQTYLGTRGNKLDRGVTLRDLSDAGLIEIRKGYLAGGSNTPVNGPGTAIPGAYEPDLIPPPTPESFAASAGISSLLFTTAAPLYQQGHGHARTVVYGATWTSGPLPTFADAVEITQFTGSIGAYPTNPATTWRLWAKWQSVDGVLSAAPAGGTNGIVAITGQDVSTLLEALSGQITADQLFSALGDRIDLIDTPTTGLVDLLAAANAAIAATDTTLDSANAVINTLQSRLAALEDTPEYDAALTYDPPDLVKYMGALYQAKTTTTGNLPTNTTYWLKIGDYASLGDAVAAQAVQLTEHDTRITTNATGLAAEVTARTTLAATVSSNHSTAMTAIGTETTARTTADTALATSITALTTTVTTNQSSGAAALATEVTARATADTAIITSVTVLTTTVSTNHSDALAAITDEATARADADSAMATTVSGVQASVNTLASDTIAAFANEVTVRANADEALATSITVLTATVADNDTSASAAIAAESSARATADEAIAETVTALTATVSGNNTDVLARITTEASARATADEAIVDSVTVLSASLDDAFAGIDTEATARADADSAMASTITTLTASVGDQTAALAVEAGVRADETGHLFGQMTVKLDVAGLISGYGLASTASNAAPASAFGVRAGQFFVAPPAVAQNTAPTVDLYVGYTWLDTSVTPRVTKYWDGSGWVLTSPRLPFVIQVAPTTVNGVAVAPGVYASELFVMNGTITNAKIGNAAIDDLKVASVSAGKLTAGSIAVGQYIQSTGYVANSSGWRINGDGNAELANAIVRGTVYATAGQIGGNTIDTTGIKSPAYVAGSSGWRINSNGTAEFSQVTARGAVMGGNYTGYGWPAPGGTGFYIGPSGLLLGNGNDGKYFQVTAGGDVYAPGFYIAGGTAVFYGVLSGASGSFAGSLSAATGTFSGSLTAAAVNAVNTINIAGNAVTVPVGAYGAATISGGAASTIEVMGAGIDARGAGVLLWALTNVAVEVPAESAGSGVVYIRIYRDGALLAEKVLTPNQPMDAGFMFIDYPGGGGHYYQFISYLAAGNVQFHSNRALILLGCQR